MNRSPKESEVTVFRTFLAELMSLQHQLEESYHADKFLRDRLLTTVNISHIQASLRDRLPQKIQKAINRVEIQLSDELKSAGTASTCTAEEDDEHSMVWARIWRSREAPSQEAVQVWWRR